MYVAVPYNEYVSLIANQMLVDMLQRDGVDNWTWYGESYNEVAQEWCAMAGIGCKEEYDGFNTISQAMLAKAAELGNLILLEDGDVENRQNLDN